MVMNNYLPEQPFFFQSGDMNIFALLGMPSGSMDLREGVILCSPAPYEIKKYHWTSKQMAQILQSCGYHTLRFDYFGSGDSQGESWQYRLDHCRLNIQDAVRHLKNSGLVRRITLVATRIGCPLALAASEEERVKRIVMIDPIWKGQEYFLETKSMHQQLCVKHASSRMLKNQDHQCKELLGFPMDVVLAWEIEKIDATQSKAKTKSITIIRTKGSPDPWPLLNSLAKHIEETQLIDVDEHLRWGQAESLFVLDFPNKLIQKVVEAVRGVG